MAWHHHLQPGASPWPGLAERNSWLRSIEISLHCRRPQFVLKTLQDFAWKKKIGLTSPALHLAKYFCNLAIFSAYLSKKGFFCSSSICSLLRMLDVENILLSISQALNFKSCPLVAISVFTGNLRQDTSFSFLSNDKKKYL